MGNFTYTAKKDRGALFTGEVIGDSKASVVAELRRKGLTVLKLEERRGLPDLKTMLENSKRIKRPRQGRVRAAVRHHDQLRSRRPARSLRP